MHLQKKIKIEEGYKKLLFIWESAKVPHTIKVNWVILCGISVFFSLFFFAVEDIPNEKVYIK